MSRKSDNAAERRAQADRIIERERRKRADRREAERRAKSPRRAADVRGPKKK
jgi:hypothetical protein